MELTYVEFCMKYVLSAEIHRWLEVKTLVFCRINVRQSECMSSLHDVITQKTTASIFIAVKTSNIAKYVYN
jgi:hypothetical protein